MVYSKVKFRLVALNETGELTHAERVACYAVQHNSNRHAALCDRMFEGHL